ncbi:MAG: hypothetical protein J2P36_02730 [Ktedonobacteraceae bacterium]|nr:hypothetical protein [Ktedonobacteraceae bacterium]
MHNEFHALFHLAGELFRRPSPSGQEYLARAFVCQHLETCGFGVAIDQAGNLLACRGIPAPDEGYPCLSFHLDMVHDWQPSMPRRHQRGTGVLPRPFSWRKAIRLLTWDEACTIEHGLIHTQGQRILGGDDKCGGAIACSLAQHTNYPLKIIASVEEEIGCLGIEQVDPSFFKDVSYVLVLDRRGSQDLITQIGGRSLCSASFAAQVIAAAASLGHQVETTEGMRSDALTIAGYVDEVVNMSVGYHRPHTVQEYVVIRELWMALCWAHACLNALPRPRPLPYHARPTRQHISSTQPELWYDICHRCGRWRFPLHVWDEEIVEEMCLCEITLPLW